MSENLKVTCGTRHEARCIDYEGDISESSVLFAEDYLTVHDVVEDIYTTLTTNKSAIELLAPIESPEFTGTVSGISKTMVGLPNVDNSSDADKPISTLQATEFNTKVDKVSGKSLIDDTEIARLLLLSNYEQAIYEPIIINTTGSQVIESLIVNGLGAITEVTLRDISVSTYTHPTNHPPSIITQDSVNRFVTDAQIESWNIIAAGGTDETAVAAIVEAYNYVTSVALDDYTLTTTLTTQLLTKEDKTNKGAVNGYVGIDAAGNIVFTGNVIINGYITATGEIASEQ